MVKMQENAVELLNVGFMSCFGVVFFSSQFHAMSIVCFTAKQWTTIDIDQLLNEMELLCVLNE